MSLLESGENYLEAILMLSQKQSEIHAIDIVNQLGYSKPSVSVMLKKLKEDGYLVIDANSHITLTEKGMTIADKIYHRHQILTAFLYIWVLMRRLRKPMLAKSNMIYPMNPLTPLNNC